MIAVSLEMSDEPYFYGSFLWILDKKNYFCDTKQ